MASAEIKQCTPHVTFNLFLFTNFPKKEKKKRANGLKANVIQASMNGVLPEQAV